VFSPIIIKKARIGAYHIVTGNKTHGRIEMFRHNSLCQPDLPVIGDIKITSCARHALFAGFSFELAFALTALALFGAD
jgi:hypothetical protein